MKPAQAKKISRVFASKQSHIHQLINQTRLLEKLNKHLKRALPKPLVQHCSVANQQEDKLVIFVDSPAWTTKIRLLTPSLIKALRPLGINQIAIKTKPKQTAHNTKPIKHKKQVPESASQLLSQLADTVANKKLKQALLRLSRQNHH